jgi:methyl-accepting chemotaxis protein
MQLDSGLDERLAFMKLGADAQESIRRIKAVVTDALPGALDQFYDQLRAFPEARRFFSNESQISAAHGKQLGHWDAISSGRWDADYVRAVTKVGEVHARIGLEPRWYIGGYALVLEALIGKVLEARWPKGRFGLKSPAAAPVAQELGAIAKAVMLDMDLAISVYLAASEEARKRVEAATLAKAEDTVRSVSAALEALARGELTYRMPDDLPVEYAQLRIVFNEALAQLQETMAAVAVSTHSVAGGSEEIAHASDDLSRRTETQAASLEQTAAALDEVTATVKRSAEGAAQAAAAAAAAKAEAVRSGQVTADAIAAMGEIEDSSGKIGQIIGLIDEIAFQTNLLALNAGVEAARAGDAGRGFAVVAQEVRALAQRSAEAAQQIKGLIASSSEQVKRGVRLVNGAGDALGGIVSKVAEIDILISEIARSSQEQATGLNQVNAAVTQMDQTTQQNAAMVEETTAAAANLRSEAEQLARLIGQFETGAAADLGAGRGGGRAGDRAEQAGRRVTARTPGAKRRAGVPA